MSFYLGPYECFIKKSPFIFTQLRHTAESSPTSRPLVPSNQKEHNCLMISQSPLCLPSPRPISVFISAMWGQSRRADPTPSDFSQRHRNIKPLLFFTHLYFRAHMYSYADTHTHMHTHTYTYTHTNVHAPTRTHTHTQTHQRLTLTHSKCNHGRKI